MTDHATEMTAFDFSKGKPGFEDLGIPNGSTTWRESDLMTALGYSAPETFRKAITRAMQACLSLGMATEDSFIRQEDGSYKITRFGCYLVAMNADSKKPEVAAAQMYFAALAETFRTVAEHSEAIDRLAIRDEMKEGVKSLTGAAKAHGVRDFGLFQNAGYRGMYNMNLSVLKSFKGLPEGKTLLDCMGRAELAANLFRVTQTEERIKSRRIRGQEALENAAENVGRNVRRMVIDNTGTEPEHLPLAAPITEVKKAIKGAGKKLKALDGKKG